MLAFLSCFALSVLAGLVSSWLFRRLTVAEPPEQSWLPLMTRSLVPIVFPLGGFILSRERWVLEPQYALLIVVLLFGLGLLIVIGSAKLRRFGPAVARVPALGLVVALIVFLALDSLLPKHVSLICSQEMDAGGWATLRGRVLETAWQPYLLIRPRRSGGAFVCKASPPDQNGEWFATCAYGGGPDSVYEVMAVVVEEDSFSGGPTPLPETLERQALRKSRTCVIHKR